MSSFRYPDGRKTHYSACRFALRLTFLSFRDLRGRGGNWWTRSQRLRTVAQVLIEAEFTQPVETPLYQSIATRVAAMRDRGDSVSAIAKDFAVDHHTVDKALRWFRSR